MNKALAILHLFPKADPMNDFIVADHNDDRGPQIVAWNVKDDQGNDVPQPTEAQLQAAWAEIENAPEPKPEPTPEQIRITQLESESVETMLGLAEVYETTTGALAVREQETVDTMLGLAEAYEIILMQQTTIEALSARVAALEGGES